MTPTDARARTELAAVASGLSVSSFGESDNRAMMGVVSAARSALVARFASLTFFGPDADIYMGPASERDALEAAASAALHIASSADETVEYENLADEASLSAAPFVRGVPSLRWMITVPVRGYNGLVIGALSLFDDQPRLVLSDSERSTLLSLSRIVEATVESHRARVIARAQRSLLVHKLHRAHSRSGPSTSDRRRQLHQLHNALTILRLNSQVIEEQREFDADAFADMRNSIRTAEKVARQMRVRSLTPHESEKMTWARVCDWQARRVEMMPQTSCEIEIYDESPNLQQTEAPPCLADVASLIVDRAVELSNGTGLLKISLRLFPHFIRFAASISSESSLAEPSSLIDPVYTHPARNALVAIGGGIIAEPDQDSVRQWSAWFPLDPGHNYII